MTGSSRQRPPLTPLQRLFRPESRRATVSWLSAAAVTLIVAGWGAIAGVRQMLIPPPITEYSVRSAAESAPLQDDAARSLGGLGTQPGGTALGGSGTATATVEPRMVVLEGDAYRYAGPAPEETDRAALKSAGRIVTALDTGASARSYTAYRGDAPEQIFIDRQGELHRFERIWLTYEGSMYKLKSGPITSFGEWPTWPSPATKPRTESGAPSMREAGEADGTKVFVPTSGEAGIALPPQPAAPSALAGCPEWTWWEPTTPF